MKEARETKAEGIRIRHGTRCGTATGSRCNCRPKFEARVYVAREGKRIERSFTTMAAAKSWRREMLARAERGTLRTPTRQTVREAADLWLAGARSGAILNRSGRPYKPSALRGYERALRLRVLPWFGQRRLAEIARADVQAFADEMRAAGCSASTVQNTLDPLRAIFRRAVRDDVVVIDPTKGLDLLTPSGRRERVASVEEAAKLIEAIREDDRALWATAFYAGLRRGELRELRWSDVDLEAGFISVARSLDDDGEVIDPKTRAGRRRVPILGSLRPVLLRHQLRSGRRASDLVFGAEADRAFVPSSVRRRAMTDWGWQDVAGGDRMRSWIPKRPDRLDPITLHEARHTFASILIASGASIKAIQTAMGHASATMTLDQYGHLLPGEIEHVRERADALLAATSGNYGG